MNEDLFDKLDELNNGTPRDNNVLNYISEACYQFNKRIDSLLLVKSYTEAEKEELMAGVLSALIQMQSKDFDQAYRIADKIYNSVVEDEKLVNKG